MESVSWTISEPNGEVKVKSDKLPHVAKIRIVKDMSEGQREFAEQFNLMRQTLIDHGLMEPK